MEALSLPDEFPFALPWPRWPAIVCLIGGVQLLGMICRQCGCEDENPCMTAAGPCAWVDINLCSACVEPGLELP